MANSSVSNFVNTVSEEKEKKQDTQKDTQKEEHLKNEEILPAFIYQIDNNFLNLKTNLKLLDSTYDIWNFHLQSSVNVSTR